MAAVASPTRFLCDEMLKGLGRWLRVAGYDTRIANDGDKDRELIQQAMEEKRLFLTRDRKIMEIRHAKDVSLLLQSNSLADWAQELKQCISLDWLYNPFSRCLLCNTPLIHAEPQCIQQVPKQSQEHLHTLLYCRHCDKLYWDGGHVKRMRKQLTRWKEEVQEC